MTKIETSVFLRNKETYDSVLTKCQNLNVNVTQRVVEKQVIAARFLYDVTKFETSVFSLTRIDLTISPSKYSESWGPEGASGELVTVDMLTPTVQKLSSLNEPQ